MSKIYDVNDIEFRVMTLDEIEILNKKNWMGIYNIGLIDYRNDPFFMPTDPNFSCNICDMNTRECMGHPKYLSAKKKPKLS